MKTITVTIPPKGRSFTKTMERLYSLGLVPADLKTGLSRILEEDAERVKRERDGIIRGEIERYTPKTEVIGILDDYLSGKDERYRAALKVAPNHERRGRPYRLMFDTLDIEAGDVMGSSYRDMEIRLEGVDHILAPDRLLKHFGEIGIIGFDEIALSMFPQMRDYNQSVKRWNRFNEVVSTGKKKGFFSKGSEFNDLRIAGSMGLDDHTIHVVIQRDSTTSVGQNGGDGKIFVDDKYQGMYAVLYKGNERIVPCDNIEDYVAKNGGRGIVIMNSGKTVSRKGVLEVVGGPLIVSETCVAYDEDLYEPDRNPETGSYVQAVVELLSPMSYDSEERMRGFKAWYKALEGNVGEKWRNGFPGMEEFL